MADLMRLARQAQSRQSLLAGPLFGYQERFQLTDEQLAQTVGVSVARLAHLALCRLPQSDADLEVIVSSVDANVVKLRAWWWHVENMRP